MKKLNANLKNNEEGDQFEDERTEERWIKQDGTEPEEERGNQYDRRIQEKTEGDRNRQTVTIGQIYRNTKRDTQRDKQRP